MGISRDSRHKRRATGGKRAGYRKKRQFELARPPASTKIGAKRVHPVRTRGGNTKHRAIRLDHGTFSWKSENISAKCKIINVTYNASNTELIRTNTLVKNCIVTIEAGPFKSWYEAHYGAKVGKKKGGKKTADDAEEKVKRSLHVTKKIAARSKDKAIEQKLEDNFAAGRLYACISSRPGQSGRADGYILEGKELEFYLKQMAKK